MRPRRNSFNGRVGKSVACPPIYCSKKWWARRMRAFAHPTSFYLRPAARRKTGDDEIDHLVERRARLAGALRDHLRMEEAHHRGADAHRRQRHVRGLEF